MNSDKLAARVIGLLFLLATASYMTGTGLIDSLLNSPNSLMQVYPARFQMILGVLLQFVDVIAIMGIGIVFYPILRKQNEAIAVSYVATRVLESVFLVIGGIGSLMLIPLSQEMTKVGASQSAYFQTLGALLNTQMHLGYQIAMLSLGLGSLAFCYLLYRSRLVPRWMSGMGLIGYFGLAVGAVLELFGIELGLMFSIPGGLFELILPVWLIIKGFDSSSIVSKAAQTGRVKSKPVKSKPAKTVMNMSNAAGVAQAYTALGE